ncbi:MAG: hypothetical protein ACI9CA_002320 [Natronomonas sp.]|jgi:hypothetical protein
MTLDTAAQVYDHEATGCGHLPVSRTVADRSRGGVDGGDG